MAVALVASLVGWYRSELSPVERTAQDTVVFATRKANHAKAWDAKERVLVLTDLLGMRGIRKRGRPVLR